MKKLQLDRAVVVEGKYDQQRLSSLIDGVIIPLGGFRIYKDKEKAAMIRAIAQKQGLIVLTDSDRAGFQLRNYIRSVAKDADIVNLYIPQIKGKEKRKEKPGAEGLLGVEGMNIETLRAVFERAGVWNVKQQPAGRRITRIDFYQDGLLGGKNSAIKRRLLLQKLQLPTYLSTNGLLEIINLFLTYNEYLQICREAEEKEL